MVGTRSSKEPKDPAARPAKTKASTQKGSAAKSPKTAGGKFFDKYATAPERMGADGVEKLFEDLGVDPTDPVALVLAYVCQAATMGEFSAEEWGRGMQHMGCTSVAQLKSKVPTLRAQLTDLRTLKEIYAFTFDYSLDEGVRRLQVEVAVALWTLLLPPAQYPLMAPFVEWIATKEEYIKRDLWSEVWSFATTVKPDLSNYDENPAWPVTLDEFVEHHQAQAKA